PRAPGARRRRCRGDGWRREVPRGPRRRPRWRTWGQAPVLSFVHRLDGAPPAHLRRRGGGPRRGVSRARVDLAYPGQSSPHRHAGRTEEVDGARGGRRSLDGGSSGFRRFAEHPAFHGEPELRGVPRVVFAVRDRRLGQDVVRRDGPSGAATGYGPSGWPLESPGGAAASKRDGTSDESDDRPTRSPRLGLGWAVWSDHDSLPRRPISL